MCSEGGEDIKINRGRCLRGDDRIIMKLNISRRIITNIKIDNSMKEKNVRINKHGKS